MADRLMKNVKMSDELRHAYGTGKPILVQRRLTEPLQRPEPTLIAVQFMGDIFHDRITSAMRFPVWEIMEKAAHHTFLILTKRAGSMAEWCRLHQYHPSQNIWMGASIEDQQTADLRIAEVISTPAAKRWLSIEPLIGPIDLGVHGLLNIDWVVVGCESGPERRPCPNKWIEDIVKQCKAARVAVWVKQIQGNPQPIRDAGAFPMALRIREPGDYYDD